MCNYLLAEMDQRVLERALASNLRLRRRCRQNRRRLHRLQPTATQKGIDMSEQQLPGVGVVGCGYWGRNLVRNFHALGSLRAVCDVEKPRLEEIRQKYAVGATQRFDEMLRMPNIQAVAIAAPAAQHFELAKSAMLAGKDVFVEKPLALRTDQGEELVRLARKHSRILMVGHLLHYHPAVVELRRLLHAGELGKIEYISSSRLNLGKLRTEEDISVEFCAARYFGHSVLVGRGSDPGGGAGRQLLEPSHFGRHADDFEFRQRR